jgi:mannosyl-3-phosphoglycerate synthase
MIIDEPRDILDYGYIRLHTTMKILEIDGRGFMGERSDVYPMGDDVVSEVFQRIAYVIIEKNLDFHTFWSIITAFPHMARVIVVSLSSRKPYDRYFDEVRLARLIMHKTGRWVGVFTLYDPTWEEVLEKTPFKVLLNDDGTVKTGRGEAYVLGTMVASWMASSFVGYIDGNNLTPGAAYEYAMAFATIFDNLREHNDVMVRIKRSTTGLIANSNKALRKRAKASQIINDIVNMLISKYEGKLVHVIDTADSTDVGMTMETAEKLPWAGGNAPEIYHVIYLLERCWLDKKAWYRCPFAATGMFLYQIEAVSPQLHYEYSDEELLSHIVESLGIVYHSSIADDEIKDKILETLRKLGYKEDEPPKPVVYPPTAIMYVPDIIDEYVEKSEIAFLPY